MNNNKKIALALCSITIGVITVVIGNYCSVKMINILRNIFMDTYLIYPNQKLTIVYIVFNLLIIALVACISYIIIKPRKRKRKK